MAIKKYLRLGSMLAIVLVTAACTQNDMKHPTIIDRIEQSKEGAELFISPDYRVVSDIDEIMKLEPSVLSKNVGDIKLLDIIVRIKNEGIKQASNLDVKINEPTPLNYFHASFIGIKGSHLKSNDETELRYLVAFDADEKLASFKKNVTFTITWDEDNVREQITVGF
ncbi:hypothetical protein [Paenibacillus agilis]|uniref:DUF4352 domain-containing protein n=1 Tax=Paenibacillus agilis TaxID=3020863 RepID=A0A559IL20_9BACL|nr:hypothetical protein [Paenibacillus agilis]TVX88331.1 hypothetical protein FPZ44_20825 [Paenibacillus agilis]